MRHPILDQLREYKKANPDPKGWAVQRPYLFSNDAVPATSCWEEILSGVDSDGHPRIAIFTGEAHLTRYYLPFLEQLLGLDGVVICMDISKKVLAHVDAQIESLLTGDSLEDCKNQYINAMAEIDRKIKAPFMEKAQEFSKKFQVMDPGVSPEESRKFVLSKVWDYILSINRVNFFETSLEEFLRNNPFLEFLDTLSLSDFAQIKSAAENLQIITLPFDFFNLESSEKLGEILADAKIEFFHVTNLLDYDHYNVLLSCVRAITKESDPIIVSSSKLNGFLPTEESLPVNISRLSKFNRPTALRAVGGVFDSRSNRKDDASNLSLNEGPVVSGSPRDWTL